MGGWVRVVAPPGGVLGRAAPVRYWSDRRPGGYFSRFWLEFLFPPTPVEGDERAFEKDKKVSGWPEESNFEDHGLSS